MDINAWRSMRRQGEAGTDYSKEAKGSRLLFLLRYECCFLTSVSSILSYSFSAASLISRNGEV